METPGPCEGVYSVGSIGVHRYIYIYIYIYRGYIGIMENKLATTI